MKFIIAVVMLALAISTKASVVPLAYYGSPWNYDVSPYISPLSYTAHHGPYYAPVAYSHHAAITPVHYTPVHTVAHVAPVEGSYVAANRGSVHVAPLPGHAKSASSINLDPAPGTW